MSSLNLDPGTFGGTKACHILVEKLNAAGDPVFANAIISRFNKYFETIGELMHLDNPTRDIMLKLWLKEMERTSEVLRPKFERYDINYSYFHNILMSRMRQGFEHGALLEKFRGKNTEHQEVLYELRMLAKAQSRR